MCGQDFVVLDLVCRQGSSITPLSLVELWRELPVIKTPFPWSTAICFLLKSGLCSYTSNSKLVYVYVDVHVNFIFTVDSWCQAFCADSAFIL